MRKGRSTLLWSALVLMCPGCLADFHQGEQKALRDMILTLYEDQVWDNLVRVYTLKPIVQLRYTDMTGTLMDKASVGIGGEQEDAADVLTSLFKYDIEGSRENQLSITANPIIDGGSFAKEPVKMSGGNEEATFKYVKSIYQEYIDFVWEAPPSNEADKAEDFAEDLIELTVNRVSKALKTSPDDKPELSKDDVNRIHTFVRNWIAKKVPELLEVQKRSEAERGIGIFADPARPADPAKTEKFKSSRDFGIPTGKERGELRFIEKIGKYTYWVPKDFEHEFFNLMLRVSVAPKGAGALQEAGDPLLNELRLQRLRFR